MIIDHKSGMRKALRTKPERGRDNGLDLLRIISTVAVILIHVNAQYFIPISGSPSLSDPYYVTESMLNIVTRFSVPCFVMISGAFILGYPPNKDYKKFYLKSFKKIFAPLIVIVTLLFIYDEAVALIRGGSLLAPVKGILSGQYYNLWFMSMLAGLYVFAPFIIMFREQVGRRAFFIVSVAFCLWACVSQAASTQRFPYSIGVVVAFLSYFMLGRAIYDFKGRGKGVLVCFFTAALMFAVTFYVRYRGVSYYLFDAYTNFFSPTVMIASAAIFRAFTVMDIKRDLSWLSSFTFYIYCFHTFVYSALFEFAGSILPENQLLSILAVTLATAVLSFMLAYLFKRIWEAIEKKPRPMKKA